MRNLPFSVQLQICIWIVLFILVIWEYRSCSKPTVLIGNDDCRLSRLESDEFICEPDSFWNERKRIYHSQDKENMMKRPDTYYFARNWEPNFHCQYAQRIGAMGDGGKWVCDVHRIKQRRNCLVYSVGSSGDFSFEIDLKKAAPHCDIHSFDQGRYPCPPEICTFHQITFGDGIRPNGSKSWSAIIDQLNHSHQSIEILKVDIEGGEYAFFSQMFTSNPKTWPRQILVEMHPTNVTIVHQFFERLRSKNYVIFSKENNLVGGPYFFEYAFLKLNSKFFHSMS